MERAPAPPGWELRRGCAAEPRLCTWAEPRQRPPRDSEPGRRLSTLGPPARSPELGKRGRCGGAVGPTQPAALGACRGFPRGGRTLRERAAGETRLQTARRGWGGSERGFAPPPRRRRACTRGSRRRRELSVDARVHKPTPASPLRPPGAATQTRAAHPVLAAMVPARVRVGPVHGERRVAARHLGTLPAPLGLPWSRRRRGPWQLLPAPEPRAP